MVIVERLGLINWALLTDRSKMEKDTGLIDGSAKMA
jgi:hypothetical protein